MRVILIEEDRFAEVSAAMKAEVLETARRYPQGYPEGMTETQRMAMAEQIHRTSHRVFVRWAQSHGASCLLS